MNSFLYNDFIFSSRFKLWRHLIYWSVYIIIWSTFWIVMGPNLSYGRQVINAVMWVPCFIIFSYPLVYGAIPFLLLKGKVLQFFLVLLAWGAFGLMLDAQYRSLVLIPLQEAMGLKNIIRRGPIASSYLCMTTSAASPMIIKFYKLLTIKKREWMLAQQEKISAELQLLKAQVHPNFLFKTLNSIYTFSVDRSPRTPDMILKLSSLLSYMLYDCRSEEVRLEKDLEFMKYYIDLENERHGNKIDVSWNVEGEVSDQFISPLLMLPMLENAVKFCSAVEVSKPWIGVDISVKHDTLRCKIANSKDEGIIWEGNSMSICNLRKRLEFFYPENHEMRMSDEGNFMVISMVIKINAESRLHSPTPLNSFSTLSVSV